MTRTKLALAVAAFAGAAAFAWWRLAPTPAPASWQGYVDADYVKVAPTQQGLLTSLAVHRGDTVQPARRCSPRTMRMIVRRAMPPPASWRKPRRGSPTSRRPAAIPRSPRRERISPIFVAPSDRIAKDLQRAEELLRTGRRPAARRWISSAPTSRPWRTLRGRQAKLEQMRSPTGRELEIAAQRAMVAQARAATGAGGVAAGSASGRSHRSRAGGRHLCAAGRDHQLPAFRWSRCCRRRTSWCASSCPRPRLPPSISATGCRSAATPALPIWLPRSRSSRRSRNTRRR